MILEVTKKQFAGHTMRFGNEEVKIGKDGKFEIKDSSLGKEIVDSFDWIFEEGKAPTPEDKAKEIDPADKETVENLYLDLEKSKDTIKRLKNQIEVLEEEKKEWQRLYKEQLQKNESYQTPIVNMSQGNKEPEGDQKSELEIKLESMAFEELKDFYKGQGGSLQGIKSKEQLIKKIVELDQK